MTHEERRRRRYRPRRVRVLVVGESPPVSGRSFYAANSGLYRALRAVFEHDRGDDSPAFLEAFRDAGWLLVDLCPRPVNHLMAAGRRRAHERGVPALAHTLRTLRPDVVVVVVRSVAKWVRLAADQSGWTGTYLELPYPGRWQRHRRRFQGRLRRFLATATGLPKP